MKYKAVIFDLFGTLIEKFPLGEGNRVLSEMASVLSVPPDDFTRMWFDTFDERGLGVFQSIEDNIEYICRELGARPADSQVKLAAKLDLEYYLRSLRPRPGATEVLGNLKSRGCRTGLVSNCGALMVKVWSNLPFAPFLDVAVFSCSVGVQKPDPRIYRIAIRKLVVEPQDCLYIGDGDCRELTGASQVGMHPVLIRNPDEDSTDVHRVDFEGEQWDGPIITSLTGILALVQ